MNPTLSPMRQKLIGSLLFLLLVVLGTILIWQRFGEQSPSRQEPPRNEGPEGTILPVFGQAPDFSLTERSGRAFSKSDLTGKPWIADFIFTSCAGQCPLMSLEMRRLQRLFQKEIGLRFVSFTVDPERDTPEVLSQYADRYDAEKNRWFFLTGPQGEMNRILNGFFLSPVDQPAMHSIRFILVDGEDQMRGYYDSSDAAAIKQLVHDVRILIK